MKPTMMILALIFSATLLQGQDNAFDQAMIRNIKAFGAIKTTDDLQGLANNFERIAEGAPGRWEPLYYSAYSYILMCYQSGNREKTDAWLDKGQTFLDKAMTLDAKNAELLILQGMLHQARIQVDPMARGMEFSMKSEEFFEKAKTIDPENPRIYYLQASSLMYTPVAFGGGPEAACPLLTTAIEKYKKFVPASDIAPAWGEEHARELAKANCGE